MLIKCREVIQLPSLKKLKLVAGNEGLDRIVKWVHVCDMPDVVNWVRGGELLFMTGMSLKNSLDLMDIVREISAKKLAGLVLTGTYLQTIPAEVLELANSLKFPVFELPWEIKLVEVIKEVATYINSRQSEENSIRDILKNLIFGEIDNPVFIISQAAYYNYDLNEPSQVAVVRIANLEDYVNQSRYSTESEIAEIKEHFQQIVLEIVARSYMKPLYLSWLDSLIIFLPAKKQNKNAIDNNIKITHKFIEELSQIMPGLIVNVGLGDFCVGPKEIRKSHQQAEQALKFAKASTKSGVYAYERMGLNKLLFAVDEDVLRSFFKEYIQALKEYDQEHNTNLVNDLEVYLEHNGNNGEAAKSLYIHRNTLIYRINKIEELTGKSLDDFQNRIGFYIGIMAGKYFY